MPRFTLARCGRSLAFGAALLVAGCAGQTEQTTNTETQEYSSKLTFTSRSEAALQQGREAVAMGRFEEGLSRFQAVYADGKASSEHREEALFAIGQVWSNVLNPKRDVSRAIATYEKFLAEFPESKLRVQVEDTLHSLQSAPAK
jgi:hypothetical protein